jgi:hypothetical protein
LTRWKPDWDNAAVLYEKAGMSGIRGEIAASCYLKKDKEKRTWE